MNHPENETDRSARVEQLRRQVETGEYQPKSSETATAIVREALEERAPLSEAPKASKTAKLGES